MYTIKALTVAVAGLVAAVNASPAVVKRDLNHVTTWSNSDCSGNSEFVYTDVSQDFCFEGAGGASFSDFGSTCGQGGGFVRTWSGGNCLGSSQDFSFPEGCNSIPFASIELFCFEDTGY